MKIIFNQQVDIHSGQLIPFLTKVINQFADHIRSCVLCLAKGFFCEICGNGNVAEEDVLFPFDERTSLCQGEKKILKLSGSNP